MTQTLVRLLPLLLLAPLAFADELKPIAGVFAAEPVPNSPTMTASGLAWWDGKLIVADRVPKLYRAHTPPDGWAEFKQVTHPVGAAAHPDGSLIISEKQPDGLHRIAKIAKDGKDVSLAESKVGFPKGTKGGVGSPHFVACHPNGTIYWSGFPDAGTRYLLPGTTEVLQGEPRIVHTYGLGLSPDHRWLYVASKIPNPDQRGVWRYPVDDAGKLGQGEPFILIGKFTTTHLKDLPPAADNSPSLTGWIGRCQGLTVDRLGYVYVGGAESHHSGAAVAVFTPDGKALAAMITGVPRNISGLAFGAADGKTLYVTGAGEYKLHQVKLPVPGEVFRAPEAK